MRTSKLNGLKRYEILLKLNDLAQQNPFTQNNEFRSTNFDKMVEDTSAKKISNCELVSHIKIYKKFLRLIAEIII